MRKGHKYLSVSLRWRLSIYFRPRGSVPDWSHVRLGNDEKRKILDTMPIKREYEDSYHKKFLNEHRNSTIPSGQGWKENSKFPNCKQSIISLVQRCIMYLNCYQKSHARTCNRSWCFTKALIGRKERFQGWEGSSDNLSVSEWHSRCNQKSIRQFRTE